MLRAWFCVVFNSEFEDSISDCVFAYVESIASVGQIFGVRRE